VSINATSRKSVAFHGKASLEAARRKMTRVQKKVAKLEQAHHEIAVKLDQWVQQNFRSEGGKVGGWQPFAPSTLRRMLHRTKRAPRTSPKLLQDTGRLRASFKPFWTNQTAGIGTTIYYARFHDPKHVIGHVPRGKGVIPERRMLPDEEDAVPLATEVYKDHVRRALHD